MVIEILMPALSPTMTAGNLTKWCKKIGDKVRAGDVLIEIETDKSTMEYESVESGILAKIFVDEGAQAVKVNSLICIFAEPGEKLEDLANYQGSNENDSSDKISDKANHETIKLEERSKNSINENNNQTMNSREIDSRMKISPIARKIAEEKNIDLKKIVGTGPDGRIVKNDVLNLSNSSSLVDKKYENNVSNERQEDQRISISGMRKVIGDRLLFSKTNIPHFYLNSQCIVDDLISMRKKINDSLETKITINDLIVKAVAAAMNKFPEVNRCWGGDHIVQCGNIDIAVAVDIPDGLITPVVQSVNKLTISDLSLKIKDLVLRAREMRLKPEEYQGGSITISNLGMFGVKNFSAIINPPQASILSIGGVFKQPIVLENDEIKIKSIMEIGISSDHRIVDGALAAKFLNEVKKFIENPILFLV